MRFPRVRLSRSKLLADDHAIHGDFVDFHNDRGTKAVSVKGDRRRGDMTQAADSASP